MVRAIVHCDTCAAPRVIYSKHAVGESRGPSQSQLGDLLAGLEEGFICGDGIDED